MSKSLYKLTIAYDGTAYGGWQVQNNTLSIQFLIQQALFTVLRKEIFIHGSGRTDAGVHAMGQVAHFIADKPIDVYKMKASLNSLLPSDIRILSLENAPLDFHARYSARSKTYHYRLSLNSVPNPLLRRYVYRVPHPVNLSLLKKAATYFIGTHDFTSFANEALSGSASKDPVRCIYRLDVVEEVSNMFENSDSSRSLDFSQDEHIKEIRLEFQGDGFLYKMVRNIVGTLLDISQGKILSDQIPEIFAAKDRRRAGRTAPAHGLVLFKVEY